MMSVLASFLHIKKRFMKERKERIMANNKTIEKPLNYEKEMIDCFNSFRGYYNLSTVWFDFVTMFACAISNSVDSTHFDEREKLYLSTINKYKKEEQELFPKLTAIVLMALNENPNQDFLGTLYMNLGLGKKGTSQFFTPYHICELMSKMTVNNVIDEVKEKGIISISDPCSGAGATLIAGVNTIKQQLEKEHMDYRKHVLVAAQDIDFTVAAMCYIQLSILGVAGFVKVGNSLSEPISEKDSLENYWYTPMYFQMHRSKNAKTGRWQ